MRPPEILARANIAEVWHAVGGGPLRKGRGQAFWRNGDGWNVHLDLERGRWYDFAHGEGGGILRLIEVGLPCDRRMAVQWLADFVGLPLNTRWNPHKRIVYAHRRRDAEQLAANLTARRRRKLGELLERRNCLWDLERTVSRWARENLNDPTKINDWRWDGVWAHALDDQRGDEINQQMQRLENASPAELLKKLTYSRGLIRLGEVKG